MVVVGSRHTCGLLSKGPVWCWGANANGQLGDGSIRDRVQPVKVKR
jgi:alpha-tubulin suppressor-like RCC1 family protein